MTFQGLDALAVLHDVLGIVRVQACLPPHVPVPKPGPCKGVKRPGTAVKNAARKAVAGRRTPSSWTPVSRRVPGRDVEADMRADYLASMRDRPQSWEREEPQVTALIEKQDGFGDPVQVVTARQMDQAVAAGWTELWRGVRGARAADIAEQERTGVWQASVGSYGGGVYFSPRRTTAEDFRRDTDDLDVYSRDADNPIRWGPAPLYEWQGAHPPGGAPGGLIRAALDPAARVADFDTLRREQFDWIIQQTGQPWQIEQDLGFYAAMRGYDAVLIPTRSKRTDGAVYPTGVQGEHEAPQYLILNRSVLMTEEASNRYDT